MLLAQLRAQSENYSKVFHKLDSLYLSTSYSEGEQLVRSSLRQAGTANDSVIAELRLQFGIFTNELGKFSDAERSFLQAYEFFSQPQTNNLIVSASILSRLASLYADQGRFDASRNAARKQFDIYRKLFGEDHKYTALASVQLASQYTQSGNLDSAKDLLERYEPDILRGYTDSSKERVRALEVAARLALAQNDFHTAELYYLRALSSADRSIGMRQPLAARIRLGLAKTELENGKADSALKFINQAVEIATKVSGLTHPLTADCYITKGTILESQGNIPEAFNAFRKAIDIYREATLENFRYTSERERLAFLSLVRERSARIASATVRNSYLFPAAASTLYDAILLEKGMVSSSMRTQARQLAARKDTATLYLLERLNTLRSRLSTYARSADDLPKKTLLSLDSAQEASDRIEKELARRSSSFAKLRSIGRVHWNAIREILDEKDACLEILRFPYYEGERKTDTLLYVALVLAESDSVRPRLAILGTATTLEDSAVIRQYFRTMEKKGGKQVRTAGLVTKALWGGLEGLLGNATNITVSPDGIYHQFSLGSLADEKGKLLLEKYSIRYVNSSRELVENTKTPPQNNVAAIFADPAFDRDLIRMRSPIASGLETSGFDQYNIKLTPLPNTRMEAEAISIECRKAGILTKVYTDTEATEEQLRMIREPRILHIATHAQFAGGKQRTSFLTMGTNEAPEAPLISSVFFLADAGETLKGNDAGPNNDGIVTALEASELDLDGTDLVTLSACESGRGVIQPGEGVFGMPRAFQSAGAKSILIALWQVPDRETKELMANFYKYWLSGMSKSQALRKAQLGERDIVKKRYGEDIPYYWAAFVLFGED